MNEQRSAVRGAREQTGEKHEAGGDRTLRGGGFSASAARLNVENGYFSNRVALRRNPLARKRRAWRVFLRRPHGSQLRFAAPPGSLPSASVRGSGLVWVIISRASLRSDCKMILNTVASPSPPGGTKPELITCSTSAIRPMAIKDKDHVLLTSTLNSPKKFQNTMQFYINFSEAILSANTKEYCMSEYLRMSGVYWGLTVMDLMGQLHRMNKEEILEFIKSCQHECGGISASIGHDPHLLYTLSAVQILTLYDSLQVVDINKIVDYVKKLQKEDGSFAGDRWVATLALLGKLDAIDMDKAVEFVLSCMNFDGGFGCRPGSESHAGQIYCCTGFLAITGQLHQINADLLGWWLCERQLPSGGLNGRPEKLPDVCYSWWVLASLKIIGRLHWIDRDKLRSFILACQDEETGGFADRPGDMVDPFHTLFGIAGLSLLGEEQIKPVNPVFCMPEEILQRVNVQPELVS
ncbi:hypothetical protein JD844_017756 [Phrynosoma platyrhinos]|uniref:protein geranylgeranyltransferase type II n=1 Tax=Phrynosoma platyrhinos TaxID=52577 RepID=A0ABQ7SMF3_PHRPL|nr:hypothetical protein JD844_017756 [Phrynosoma platyrhinos]